jgi:hypothetical protein
MQDIPDIEGTISLNATSSTVEFYRKDGISLKNHSLGFALIASALFLSAFSAQGQLPTDQPAGAVPSALRTAGKIFISNCGSDSGLFPSPFSGDPNRPYIEFYEGLKATGQFDVVGDPANADLVLELRLVAPSGPTNPNKQYGASDPLPMFRLTIYDRKTHYILWTLTESIDMALLQKTHDRNFDSALNAIVQDFMDVTGKAPAPPPSGAPVQAPAH